LRPIAADAVKRVNCRDAVQQALEAGDPRAAAAAFQKALLDGWADKRLIADAEAAVVQVGVLDNLKKAVATPGDGRALVKLWTSEGFKVAGLSEAAAYETDAKTWDARITAAETFINLYRVSATEQALANAWEKVADAGEHPDLKPEHRTRGEQAQKRAPLLAKLAAVPPAASYKNDTAFLAVWGDGSALAGCKEADRYIPHINTARDRINKVAALKRAIDTADSGSGSEAGIVDAAKPLTGYEHPYVDRVILGKKSVAALAALKTAVDEKPPSDRAIAAALDELRTTNVELLARLDKVDPVLAAEATAAGRRRKVLNEFAELDRKYSETDKQDRKWQALWLRHKELLQGRRDTEELRDRLTLAVNRTRACEALLAALDAREMFKLRELHEKFADKLRGYPPVLERKDELNELLTKADRVIEIQKKLETQAVMLTEQDLQFLRENHTAFRKSDREAIVKLVTNKLKTDAKLIAGRPQVKVVPNGRAVAVTACWAWAGYGLVSHCLVAVDKNKHLTSPSEADQYGLLKCQLREHTGEGGGKRVAPPRGANKVFITVWTVVELGWTTVYGPPLHLGPAAVTPQW
jgi:hypothetical protein